MAASAPLPKDDPSLIAWETFKQSEDFANSRRWAVKGEQYVDGSMWRCFLEGYQNALDGLNPDAVAEVIAAAQPFKQLHDEILECAARYSDEYADPNNWVKACTWEDLQRMTAALAKLGDRHG